MDYDTVVIGSGFGAACAAYELAAAGERVLMLARSRALWPLRYDDPDHSLSRARDVVDLIERIYREIDPARRRPSLATV